MFGFLKKKTLDIISPVNGEIIEIEKVADQVFSQKMLGDGFAVNPKDGKIKAPADGKIIQIFPTNHAFGIAMENGIEILVHIGIDTVELKGEGFTKKVESGSLVKKGDIIIEVDLEFLKSKGKDVVTPVIFTKSDNIKTISFNFGRVSNIPAAVLELK